MSTQRGDGDTPPFRDAAVAQAFAAIGAFSPTGREKLLTLRALIFDIAASTPGVGELRETLKWGEPAYLPAQPRIGSTVRLGCKPAQPDQVAMYFHCQTTLVQTFRTLFPHDFRFEGNRALLFDVTDALPMDALGLCVAAALTYHLK